MAPIQITDQPMEPISDRTPVSLGLVLSLIGVAVAILLAYSALDKRVSAMEDRTRTVQQDIAEMKGDIKQLLRRP